MRKTINKIVSGLITLTLLLSLTPVAIFAEEDVDKQPVETSIVETTKETKSTKSTAKSSDSKEEDKNTKSIPKDEETPTTEAKKDVEEPPKSEKEAVKETEKKVAEISKESEETTAPTKETAETTEESKETEATTTAEPTETTKETEATEPSSETAAPTKSTEPSTASEETKPSDETEPTESTESTESSDETEPTESTDETEPTESTDETEPSESTEETKPEVDSIIKATSAKEYLELVGKLSNSEKLIVETKADLSSLAPKDGVYFDGLYTLQFNSDKEYDNAVKFVKNKGYKYTEDGKMTLCSVGQFGITRISNEATVNGKKVVIIDTGVNGANESYSVVGEDKSDKNGHGTHMAKLIKKYAPDAYIISIKAIDDEGRGTVADVYNAFQFAADLKADVILMAINIKYKADYAGLKNLIEETAKNTVIVASAGNNRSNAVNYLPAGIDEVLTIGAVDEDYTKADVSNYGDVVDYYTIADSTSEAAAIFTGKLLVKDANDVITLYKGAVDTETYFVSDEDDIYFTTNISQSKLILNEKDLTTACKLKGAGLDWTIWHNHIVAVAQDSKWKNNYSYSTANDSSHLDCIGYVNAVYWDAMRDLNDKPKGSWSSNYYTSAYKMKNGRRAKIYEGNNAPGCSAWAYDCNISIDPSKSEKAKKISGSITNACKYLKAHANAGDIILFGKKGKNGWFHAAIYAGNNTGSSFQVYEASGTGVPVGEKHTKDSNSVMFSKVANGKTGVINSDTFAATTHKADYMLVFYTKPAQAINKAIKFTKVSTCEGKDLGQYYSFEGTTYGVYTDEGCTSEYANCPKITFDEDGNTDDSIIVAEGTTLTLYLKETESGSGYILDDSTYKITVKMTSSTSTTTGSISTVDGDGEATGAWNSGKTIYTVTLEDEPIFDPLTIKLNKVDNYGKEVNGATINGAVFRIDFYDVDLHKWDVPQGGGIVTQGQLDEEDDEDATPPSDAVYPVVSYEVTFNGGTTIIDFDFLRNKTAVGGTNPNFFKNLGNISLDQFPLGTFRIYEKTAPDGYNKNDQIIRIRLFQKTADDGETTLNEADVEYINEADGSESDGVWNYTLNGENMALVLAESPEITYYSLTKKIDANGYNLSGYNFEIYDVTQNIKIATGVSEADGRVKWTYVVTGWKSNSDPTKSLDGTATYKLELPMGPSTGRIQYEVRELKFSLSNKTKNTVPITFDTPVVANKTVTDETGYYMITETFNTPDAEITREFENKPELTQLTIRKIDASNENVSRTFTFDVYWLGNAAQPDPQKEKKYDTVTITTTAAGSGSVELKDMPLGWYKVVEQNDQNEWVVTYPNGDTHSGITNGSTGTIDVLNKVKPSIGTTLTDTTTDEHITAYGNEITLVDKVTYKGLTSGHYVVTGVLYDRSTEKPFELNGEKLTGSAEFDITPVLGAEGYEKQQSGSVNVEFKFKLDKSLMGVKLVAYEELHLTTAEGELIAEHKKINEDFQTVNVPEVRTTATDKADGDKMVDGTQKSVTVVDSVAYKNLLVGKTYTITGKLAVKKDYKEGEEIEYVKNADGSIVTATDTFEATEASGTRDLEFTFDASVYAGYQVVVFEDLYYNNILIMAHEDLEDDQQTIETSLYLHVSIEKDDANNHSYKLKNAQITIYRIKLDKDGKLTKQFKDLTKDDIAKDAKKKNCVGRTNKDGLVSFTILWDRNYKYYAKETEAPYGYDLCADFFEVVPTAKRESDGVCPIKMVIYDDIIIITTGDTTNIALLAIIAIVAIAGIAAGIIILKNKNSKKLATENTTNITETSDDTIISRPGNSINLNDEIPPTTD